MKYHGYLIKKTPTDLGEDDGWQDLTKPFDTYEEALEWAEKIKDSYGVYADVPF